MRPALAIAAILLLTLAPVAAAQEVGLPPAGTVLVVFAVSDGMTMLPVGTSTIPPGMLCAED